MRKEWSSPQRTRFGRPTIAVMTAFVAVGAVGCPGEDDETESAGHRAEAGAAGASGSAGDAARSGADAMAGATGLPDATDAAVQPTHTGLISVQDMAIEGAPEEGHGLTVQMFFTEVRAADYEETPGQPTGCKVWVYDVQDNPAKPQTNQGTVTISGVAGGPVACIFEQGAGYVCAPIRHDTSDPFTGGGGVTLGIAPGGVRAFDFADIGPIVPGGAFTLDEASRPVIVKIPLDGTAISLSCAGSGGQCGEAPLTVVRVSTTDGATAGLSPIAMPLPIDKQVEVQCATLGSDGTMTLSAQVMKFLKDVHSAAPITRIRTAYMREGFGFGTNSSSLPPNRVTALVGHGVLGFSNP